MKKIRLIQLVALNLFFALCILLPFLPGPYDTLSLPISIAGQLTGYLGLLLVPIGILWLIQEVKKLALVHKPLNNWTSGYYYAITATCVCSFIGLAFTLILAVSVGISAGLITFIILIAILKGKLTAIKALKQETHATFHAAPLYLLSIPLIAFIVCMFFISPVSNYSRKYSIEQAQKLITAIEDYRHQRGSYPPSIEYVYDVPKPEVIGIREFIYELNGDAYNLAFVQHQHLGATREVVIYNKNDQHNVKGHFASFDAGSPHWKYYWLD